MSKPAALRLADALESDPSDITGHKAASELRRLHDLLGKANALARIRAECIDELTSALRHIEGVAMADEPRDLPGIVQTARSAIVNSKTGESE